jgi:hypothetical protein
MEAARREREILARLQKALKNKRTIRPVQPVSDRASFASDILQCARLE